jgi:hypothetical protein
MGTKKYDTLVRQQCKPIHYSNKLLKHLAPLWETGVKDWHSLLTKVHTSTGTTTYHIQPTTATLSKLPNGIRASSTLQLQTALNTLRATLLQSAETEHKKLPKDPTPNSTIIHPTWHKYINTDDIPDHIPHSYVTLTNNPSPITNAPSTIPKTLKRAGPPIPQDLPDPQHTTDNPLDTTEIDGHKHLLRRTTYHVNKWRPEHLTAKQFCHHRMNGLTTTHLARDNPENEDTSILSIPFKVTWNPTWVSEATILTTPSGKTTIDKYNATKAPKRKKTRTTPPLPPKQPEGWHPRHTTFTTKPINPDLDATPTGTFEITHHPTNNNEILLHAPDGRLISTMTKTRLQKFNILHNHTIDPTPFPEALANLTHRHTSINISHHPTSETKLHKPYKLQ